MGSASKWGGWWQRPRAGQVAVAVAAIAGVAAVHGCEEDSCFIGDTLIDTPDGKRRLEDLRVGDAILSFDERRDELVVRRIEQVHRSVVRTICRVTTDHGIVQGVTPAHPFYDAMTTTYVPLRELKPTSLLLHRSDARSPLRPASVTHIDVREAPTPTIVVYNLTVEGPEHNYFADGVLVHNKSEGCRECPEDSECQPCSDARCQGCECASGGRPSYPAGDGKNCQACYPNQIDDPLGTGCITCPPSSSPNETWTRCVCDPGFYETVDLKCLPNTQGEGGAGGAGAGGAGAGGGGGGAGGDALGGGGAGGG